MKFKLNPARLYILGLWSGRRTREGVGVEGHNELCEAFLRACLEEKLAEPHKVKFEEGPVYKCYFYNSALKGFLSAELERRDERLKYRNEYAASYFAGLFDARGGFSKSEKARPYLFGDQMDEIVLLRLGFQAKRVGGKITLYSGDFYGFISPYLKLGISKKSA